MRLSAYPHAVAGIEEVAVRFLSADGAGEVSGIVHRPAGTRLGALVVTHGRSGDMRDRLVTRVARAVTEAGLLALRMNFRYVEERTMASRDLSGEEGDLRGAIRFLRGELHVGPIFVAGASMGARVCARASSDPDVVGVIALGYPLHPRFRPEVRNPPEWPLLIKPALFVQGDRDPFCDLGRLREDLTRLPTPHELVVIPNAGHSFESRGAKRDTFPEVWDAVLRWITSQLAGW